MKKIFVMLLSFMLLTACSNSSLITEEEKYILENALNEIKSAKTLSLTIDELEDHRFILEEGGQTTSTTTHIGYREHDLPNEIQYVLEETIIKNVDFEQFMESQMKLLDKKILTIASPSNTEVIQLDENVVMDDLIQYGIEKIHICNQIDFTKVNVRQDRHKIIYSFSDIDVFSDPVINIFDKFTLNGLENVEIIDYSIVIKDEAIHTITLIYETSDKNKNTTINTTLTINGIDDSAELPYID